LEWPKKPSLLPFAQALRTGRALMVLLVLLRVIAPLAGHPFPLRKVA
jgi:hypothetical protein